LGTATPVVVPIIATLTTMYLATASASSKDNHCFTNRGRIQAQGEKLEEPIAWNKNEPITAEQGLTMIEGLKSKLSKKDLKMKAERFKTTNGYDAPVSWSNLASGTAHERVDIKIRTGKAFE